MNGKMNKTNPSSASSCSVPFLHPFFPASEGSWGRRGPSPGCSLWPKGASQRLISQSFPERTSPGSSLTLGKLTSGSKCLVFPQSATKLSLKRKVFSSHSAEMAFRLLVPSVPRSSASLQGRLLWSDSQVQVVNGTDPSCQGHQLLPGLLPQSHTDSPVVIRGPWRRVVES